MSARALFSSSHLFGLAALAMGLVDKLTAKYGRTPTEPEIAAAKAKKAAKKAAAEVAAAVAAPPAPPAKIKLEVLRAQIDVPKATERNPEPKGALVVVGGVGSKANCLVTLTGSVPDKTIFDIRQCAASAFGVANGWQIYLGKDEGSAVFIGGSDGGDKSFKDEFEILLMDKVYEPKAYAIECVKGSEALRSSRPMQQQSGAVVQASAETLRGAAESVVAGLKSGEAQSQSKIAGGAATAEQAKGSSTVASSPDARLTNARSEVQKLIDKAHTDKYSVPGAKPKRAAFAVVQTWNKTKAEYNEFEAEKYRIRIETKSTRCNSYHERDGRFPFWQSLNGYDVHGKRWCRPRQVDAQAEHSLRLLPLAGLRAWRQDGPRASAVAEAGARPALCR